MARVAGRPAESRGDLELVTRVARWFGAAARALPWRTWPRDPYRSLVSELMLQQTQVSRVLEKFDAFVARFPTVRELARADERDVLAAWSGLGYYRRGGGAGAAAGGGGGKQGGGGARGGGGAGGPPWKHMAGMCRGSLGR